MTSLKQRDLSVLWHPCTQMKDHETYPLIPIKGGKGVYLEDFEGNQYIDAISSWWVNSLGHGQPDIVAAIQQQAAQLEHVIFAGFSHEPAVQLAESLVEITPSGLDRVFYGENGSSAVEIALKMSFHYWLNKGQPKKKKFVGLKNGYHGETVGALAVGDVSLYKETYAPLLFETLMAPSPDCFYREQGESWEAYSLRQFAKMEALLEEHHEEVAAVILEPLIQCAGNMRMYHPVYLKKVRELCDRLNVHLIADEIAVGFGRTGKMFACEHAQISPDFMCLSKALTSGFLPLSAVITTNEIYQAFYDDYETLRGFLHSHSFTGNPIACAAALATIKVMKEQQIPESNKPLINKLTQIGEKLSEHPHVGDVRQTGMVLAVEMMKDPKSRTEFDWLERRGMKVYQHALSQGAILRPLGNVVYFMPPYVITEEEIERLGDIAWQGITKATEA
ncbi:adenosylmethionine--8-amino-7-oxononanoate transaminase [Pleionea sp. CnH1-48]|uniref:adenosylmethionine--8-amino-7-oxononanoate transaminase n=1 Tax=Pleionea sp. CnH1-48 TaxID=2954494 RepID=UPI0020980B6F|nr:adenosylmethionine--8-amino-7-oxononanoate transaminase [Pleionea sp. CnH1-48]MCO7226208.1 adenosylmethionine--8-amino-7-oxononanoate transaminase [Pleionea sp. CnH1-48]